MSRMFPFITATWNPLGGECKHNCSYCWAKQLSKRYGHTKYQGEPTIDEKQLSRVFQHKDFVFVCDMTDLFGDWVPKVFIQRILDRMLTSQATFLLLTKNPARYLEFDLPKNSKAGATIESDIDAYLKSDAPTALNRINAMIRLPKAQKMVSIEPIAKFSSNFEDYILRISPEFVAVGYDNYNCGIEEPSLAETNKFIQSLEERGIKVYKKTLRDPLATSYGKSGEAK